MNTLEPHTTCDQRQENYSRIQQKRKGFSLIEVLIAVVLVAVALLGLAQLFTYSVLNNARSDRITNATFLAQQQIDFLRNFTIGEINGFPSNARDVMIDVNGDGVNDFRRIIDIQATGIGNSWVVRVLIFPGAQTGGTTAELIADPKKYRFRADISTIISR